jgi:RNase P/RNase MRP subunit p30
LQGKWQACEGDPVEKNEVREGFKLIASLKMMNSEMQEKKKSNSEIRTELFKQFERLHFAHFH